MKIDKMWVDNDRNPIILEQPIDEEIFMNVVGEALETNSFIDVGMNKYSNSKTLLFINNIKKIEVSVIDEV